MSLQLTSYIVRYYRNLMDLRWNEPGKSLPALFCEKITSLYEVGMRSKGLTVGIPRYKAKLYAARLRFKLFVLREEVCCGSSKGVWWTLFPHLFPCTCRIRLVLRSCIAKGSLPMVLRSLSLRILHGDRMKWHLCASRTPPFSPARFCAIIGIRRNVWQFAL